VAMPLNEARARQAISKGFIDLSKRIHS